MKIYLDVNCPVSSEEPCPPFDEKMVNESKFEHELRFKTCKIFIEDNVGHVRWLSYGSEDPTEAWEAEIKRAFIANGLAAGAKINVEFGSRDSGIVHKYELEV